MREPYLRGLGLLLSSSYALLIVWLLASQPKTMAEVTGGIAASVGVYSIDEQAFAEGLQLFRADRFPEARAAFARADRAGRDARTQFYIAYSYYRQGWSRFYHDDALYRQGLDAVARAIELAPAGRIVVDDENLAMRSGDELKAELEAGLRRELSDLNPLRVGEPRK
jgi:tetratricopeptide (TPR) repeat protein